MKRVVEKVKDIVEVCPFTHLYDFAADPVLTLGGYHFTDITADLMSKWIDQIAGIKPGEGKALALAGFRGVGKSHFLAALAAIASQPELRPRISDPHVLSSAERLSRRHNPVSVIRRGSSDSLLSELKNEVAKILGVFASDLSDSLYELLLRASEKVADLPLVLLFDTAQGRETRVSRDDGVLLSEIADAAKNLGIFVGVALDDDIAGADGPNSVIAGRFQIDYLDQEHLYKIVDTHIFSKHSQKLSVLHDIYEYYREVLPGFRWSEQRFSSLYPLHPATLEIAPLIRLYIHDFALLGFASEAGVKILGRPANSLIGLDEIFDGVERALRNAPDLSDAFAAFERVEKEVLVKTPVQTRLQAKMILKGLLLLSLDGQGSSADEIAASMLIYSETSSSEKIDVAALLDSFAAAIPDVITRIESGNSPAKYCLKIGGAKDVEDIIDAAIRDVPESIIWNVLLQQSAEKFADVSAASEFGMPTTDCSVEWRGGIRRGTIIWNPEQSDNDNSLLFAHLDWTIEISTATSEATSPVTDHRKIIWKLGELTSEEKDTIRRFYLLQTDIAIRDHLGDGLSTALHVTSIAVERIWQRVLFTSAVLDACGVEYRFHDDAYSSHSLSQVFSAVLEPLFDAQFRSHPVFAETLGVKQAAYLTSNFFSGSNLENADVQKFAETFALPLGLAVIQGDVLVPTPSESLAELPIVKTAIGNFGDSDTIPLSEIANRLSGQPYGLTREAQQLILTAVVAQRQFEFVTTSGNRINHRSLDLQIIWNDIVGIAKPLNELYSPERLLAWAKLLTGNSGIKSLNRSEDRLLVIDSLSGWLSGWRESRILDEFDALPEENLNAAIWRTAASLRKSFGAMGEQIDALIRDETSLDQCLHTVADLFSDSEHEYERKKGDLRILKEFTESVKRHETIARYLSLSEITTDQETEAARNALLMATGFGYLAPTAPSSEDIITLWADFKDLYINHYAIKHDAVMGADSVRTVLAEIFSSDNWAVFESFSPILWFDLNFSSPAKDLIRRIRQSYCAADVALVLENTPFCGCSFSLAEYDRVAAMPVELKKVISDAMAALKTKLLDNRELLVGSAETDAMSASVAQLLDNIETHKEMPKLTSQEVRIIRIAAERVFNAEDTVFYKTRTSEADAGAYLPAGAHEWDQEVEQLEVFANRDV